MLKKLKPFQEIGRDFLAERHYALLADEMGLGKTVQAIAAADAHDIDTALVVCPASVRMGWFAEIRECLGVNPGWDVISYNAAQRYAENCKNEWPLLILDEAHFLKNPESQRTQAVFGKGGLARRAKRVWALTGSPLLNRPVELYPILKTMASEKIAPFNTFALYAHQFCGAYYDGRGLNVRGSSNLADLKRRLEGFMLRRTQEEVLAELPDLIVSRVPVTLGVDDEKKIMDFEREVQDRDALLSPSQEVYAQLGDLATLMRVTGEAMVGPASAYVAQLLETQDKVVVFAHHREVIRLLDVALGQYGTVIYQGGMSDQDKMNAIGLFMKDGGPRVFIGNIKAAGTGINGLQSVAHNVVFAELSWVPGEVAQAIGRLKRMGQKAHRVHAHVLHAPGTLYSAVLAVHDGKNAVIDKVLGREEEKVGLGGLW